jgi:CBS domain containing-hemolysin-like protein
MTALTMHNVEASDHLVSPEEFTDVGLYSPALAVFTDFRRHEPLVIEGSTRAADAAMLLRQSHTRLQIVVDRNREFIGTITQSDLSEANLLRKVAAGETRQAIQVAELMKPRHELRALSYSDVERATVKDLIDTLQTNGEHHCLVVNAETHNIRGLIAASDVEKRLHMNLHVDETPTFAEIFQAVHGKPRMVR